MTRFLKPKEASAKLMKLGGTWDSVAKGCEELSEYKSGLDDKFSDALSEIRKGIGECSNLIGQLTPSLEHRLPERREDVGGLAAKARSSLEEFAKKIDAGLEDVNALKRINKQISDLTVRLERSEKEFREAEARTTDSCSKYFERKKDYELAKERLINAARGKIEGLKGKFAQKLSPVLEGYELLLDERAASVEEFFDALRDKSADAEKLSLRPLSPARGFLDMITKKSREGDRAAKEIVLRFVAQEIISEVEPVRQEQANEIARLDVQFSDLRALEIDCKNAERRREALSRPREEVLNEISQLRKSDALALASYNGVLELRERCLSAFNDADLRTKSLLDSVAGLLDGYPELEPDKEKRELRRRVKELKESVDELRKVKHDLEKALGEEAEKNKRAQELLRKYRERLKDTYAQIKRAVEQLESLLVGE